jgi:hypothetical protein
LGTFPFPSGCGRFTLGLRRGDWLPSFLATSSPTLVQTLGARARDAQCAACISLADREALHSLARQ